MNTAVFSTTAFSSTAPPLSARGLAGWAVRTGRALERWGRARAARRGDRDRVLAQRAAAAAAEQALAERHVAYRSTTFGLM